MTDIGLLYLDHKASRVFIYSSYTFFEYNLFAFALYSMIKSTGFRKIIVYLSILFSIFLIFYNINVKQRGIDSIPIGIETILVLFFSFYHFYEQMNDTQNLFIYSRYTFWIVIGMMVYLAGSFFIYIYAAQLTQAELAKYWIFTNIFSIVKNIFFTIAILVHVNQSKSSRKSPPPMNYPMYTMN